MKFSVITVCLNAGQDLLDTVESVLNQTYENYEIIVKDGGSTDGSVEHLPSNNKIQVIRKSDAGIYNAMNQAIDYATGDFLIFMNCGDLFYDDSVLQKVEECALHNKNLFFYGLCYNRKMGYVNAYPKKISRMTCYRTMICHQSMILSRKLFEERKYDETYRIIADKEYLAWSVCKKKIKPQYMDFVIVNYKADGACEDKKYSEINKCDAKKINKKYFSGIERALYKSLMIITCPRLRGFLCSSKMFSKLYMKMLKLFYTVFS